MRPISAPPEVCVVGSFMMDLVARAPRRPAPGETLIGHDFAMHLGGKGFNQAIAAARNGVRTAMVGRVGGDEFGRQFLAALGREGIDATHVGVDTDAGTGVGLPVVEDSGENSIVIVPRANHRVRGAHVHDAAGAIGGARVVLLQWELPIEVVITAAEIARSGGATVVLNPAPAGPVLIDAFAGVVDYVVPNETEASLLTGMGCEGDRAIATAERLIELSGARGVVLTLGSRGVLVVDADTGRVEHIAGHDVTCVDSVGAGDAFCGALAACLAAGGTLRDAAVHGNAAGALAVGVAGAEPSMPARAAIDSLLESGALR